mmetsp:Transcript_55522/g.159657  ORF Transcript_55522/g.159657 Transcript_55522/m.159657 type:complete len:295 (-) Transcript_55522:84-968(-)
MGTWGTLMEELAQCERKLVAVRLKAEEKKGVEVKRLEAVLTKRQELEETTRRRLEDVGEEFERSLQGIVSKADQGVEEAWRVKAEAEFQLKQSEEKTIALEAKAKAMERQIHALHGMLDVEQAEVSQRSDEVRRRTDDVVQNHFEETRCVVKDVGLYSSEVQDQTLKSIADMQQEARSKIAEAEDRSTRRSRTKELQQALQSMTQQSSRDISQQDFLKVKGMILQAWLDDWVAHTHPRTPSTALPFSDASGSLKPQSPDRARSVDRARQRASELKRGGAAIMSGWGEYRPQTAS